MAITAAEIVKRLSVTAAAGDTTAQPDPNASLGDQISTTVIADATLNALFDDVSGTESAAGDTEYRCLFILNNNATLTAQNVTIAVQSETGAGTTITIGLDAAGVTAKGLGSAQAQTIANESTAPTSVTFAAGPTAVANVPAGSCFAVWVRRVVTAGTGAINPDTAVLRVSVDTLP